MSLISFVPINMVRQCRDCVASTSASPRAHATPAVYGLNLSTQKEKESLASLEDYYCPTALSQGVGRGREGITFFMMHDMEEWMRSLDGNGPHPAAFSTHRNYLVQGARAQLPKYAQHAYVPNRRQAITHTAAG